MKGKLPDGGLDEVKVQIASVVPFLSMTGLALEDRRKAKDAYDIYFLLHNYPGGVDEVVMAFRPHMKLGLVQEGLKKLAGKFASINHVGPRDVAEFEEMLDKEERTIRQRHADLEQRLDLHGEVRFRPSAQRLIAVAVAFGERRATQREDLERVATFVFVRLRFERGNVNYQLLLLLGFAGPSQFEPFG